MKKIANLLLCGALVAATTAQAYEIKHSYSADKGTEYYGACQNGKRLMIVEIAKGKFEYNGPAGKGSMNGGRASLDEAAKAACGE